LESPPIRWNCRGLREGKRLCGPRPKRSFPASVPRATITFQDLGDRLGKNWECEGEFTVQAKQIEEKINAFLLRAAGGVRGSRGRGTIEGLAGSGQVARNVGHILVHRSGRGGRTRVDWGFCGTRRWLLVSPRGPRHHSRCFSAKLALFAKVSDIPRKPDTRCSGTIKIQRGNHPPIARPGTVVAVNAGAHEVFEPYMFTRGGTPFQAAFPKPATYQEGLIREISFAAVCEVSWVGRKKRKSCGFIEAVNRGTGWGPEVAAKGCS